MKNFKIFVIWGIQLLWFLIDFVECEKPEFVRPLKNFTDEIGSNVKFTCAIKNIGSGRIIWEKQLEPENELLAINALKLTRNPRISVSLVHTYQNIVESILYIYNVEKSDEGTYECISMSKSSSKRWGTLKVIDKVFTYFEFSPKRFDENKDLHPDHQSKTDVKEKANGRDCNPAAKVCGRKQRVIEDYPVSKSSFLPKAFCEKVTLIWDKTKEFFGSLPQEVSSIWRKIF